MIEKKPPKKGTEASLPSFEEALKRLEKIVDELEGTELSLEETLARYEEGSRLVAECTRRLEDAEQRIRRIGEAAAAQTGTSAEGEQDEENGGLPF